MGFGSWTLTRRPPSPSPQSGGSFDESERLTSSNAAEGGGVTSLSLSDADAGRRSKGGPISCGLRRRRCFRAVLAASVGAVAISLALRLSGRPIPGILGSSAVPPTHPAYTIESTSIVLEYDVTVALYRHVSTQAELLAVIPRNYAGEDKTFGISFRTVPTNSNGVAHILEHSVLSGSRKYPVKDPFLHLLKGSLQTFLNAMTYNDRTVYPVASRNRQDFRNLMDVYLDAVFHPRCVEEDWVLKQEGWRYEIDEETGELEYRGVVMSEMMGAYSDPDQVMYRTSKSLLFPDTTYNFDSGGEPDIIPTLTFEEFRKFYETHYHPTNSKTFVSGDARDVKAALDLLNDYLLDFDYKPQSRDRSVIPYQKLKFPSPVRERRPYASMEGEDGGHMMSVQWLLHDEPLPDLTELALVVLDDLLLGNPSSVLRKALLDSGLGEDVITDGLEDEMLQSTFTVGLKGIQKKEDVEKVEAIILDTLKRVAENGFTAKDIEASVNSVEFKLREFNTGSYPRSVVMFLGVMSKWNYDTDPRTALEFEEKLKALKDEIRNGGSTIFQSLLQTYLVANTHQVVLEFFPSSAYEGEQLQEKKKKLASIKTSLTPTQLKTIDDDAKALNVLQSTDDPPEAVAAIPSLSLGDLDRKGIEYPISARDDAFGSGVTLVTHAIPSSSGIAYVDFGLDMSALPFEDVSLLPFLTRMMTETGTSTLTDRALDQQIGMHTGGIDVTSIVHEINPLGVDDSIVTPGKNLRTMLFVRGKCTSDKSSQLFSLYQQILKDAKLDSQQKAIQILQEMASDLKTNIPSRGSSFAHTRIAGRYGVRGFIQEEMHGVSQVDIIKVLLSTAESDWPTLLMRLGNMRRIILGSSRRGMVLNLTGDSGVLDAIKADVRDFLSWKVPLLPDPQYAEIAAAHVQDFRAVDHPWVVAARTGMAMSASIRDEGVVTSSKVNYVGRGGLLYDMGEKVPGSASVVSRYLQNGYLWENVRVKNGAYGAWASFDRHVGTLAMLSYRDPELSRTFDVYEAAADELLRDASSTALTDRDGAALTRAVIGAIGQLDGSAPHPDEVGWVSLSRWMRGESATARQRWRSEILNTKVEDFADFAQRLKSWKSPSSAVVGSQGAFDEYSTRSGSAPLKIILTV